MIKLPRVATPEHEVVLPISGKKIKIRPFMGDEEKILLMALESVQTSTDEIKIALKQIITNCILTKGIDVDKLANLDVEKIFIELRRRSVSETIDINFDLREVFDCADEICPEKTKISIRLDSIEVKNLTKEKKIIMLTDVIGVSMTYPTMESSEVNINGTKTEALFELIGNMIDGIFDGDEVVDMTAISKKDILAWIGVSFQHKHLEEAIEFMNNQPYHYKEFEITCTACGKTKKQEAKGLIDFFI